MSFGGAPDKEEIGRLNRFIWSSWVWLMVVVLGYVEVSWG